MAPEHPTSTQHEQALLCQFLTPPADPSTSLDYGAPAPMCPAHLGELGGSHHHPATPDGVVGLTVWGTRAAIWSYPTLHFEVLGCCKMQKELLGNVISIKINALTRSQTATVNVLLNEI